VIVDTSEVVDTVPGTLNAFLQPCGVPKTLTADIQVETHSPPNKLGLG